MKENLNDKLENPKKIPYEEWVMIIYNSVKKMKKQVQNLQDDISLLENSIENVKSTHNRFNFYIMGTKAYYSEKDDFEKMYS